MLRLRHASPCCGRVVPWILQHAAPELAPPAGMSTLTPFARLAPLLASISVCLNAFSLMPAGQGAGHGAEERWTGRTKRTALQPFMQDERWAAHVRHKRLT